MPDFTISMTLDELLLTTIGAESVVTMAQPAPGCRLQCSSFGAAGSVGEPHDQQGGSRALKSAAASTAGQLNQKQGELFFQSPLTHALTVAAPWQLRIDTVELVSRTAVILCVF